MKKEEKENDQDLTEDVTVKGKKLRDKIKIQKDKVWCTKGNSKTEGFVLWQYGTHMHRVLCGIVV